VIKTDTFVEKYPVLFILGMDSVNDNLKFLTWTEIVVCPPPNTITINLVINGPVLQRFWQH